MLDFLLFGYVLPCAISGTYALLNLWLYLSGRTYAQGYPWPAAFIPAVNCVLSVVCVFILPITLWRGLAGTTSFFSDLEKRMELRRAQMIEKRTKGRTS